MIIFLFSLFSQAYESSDAFIITANPTHYKVLSPRKKTKKVGLVIKNTTNDKIFGKLWSQNKGDLEIVSIKSGKMKSIEFLYDKKDMFFFIPISPPFQKVELKLGEVSYEIPTQKKGK